MSWSRHNRAPQTGCLTQQASSSGWSRPEARRCRPTSPSDSPARLGPLPAPPGSWRLQGPHGLCSHPPNFSLCVYVSLLLSLRRTLVMRWRAHSDNPGFSRFEITLSYLQKYDFPNKVPGIIASL